MHLTHDAKITPNCDLRHSWVSQCYAVAGQSIASLRKVPHDALQPVCRLGPTAHSQNPMNRRNGTPHRVTPSRVISVQDFGTLGGISGTQTSAFMRIRGSSPWTAMLPLMIRKAPLGGFLCSIRLHAQAVRKNTRPNDPPH